MTGSTYVIAGAVLLGAGSIAAGVSYVRQGREATQAAPSGSAPAAAAHGAGYSNLTGVRPGGPWPALPRRLLGPVQPVFFRHDVHAGQYRMPCLYCHGNAAESWRAYVPTITLCMGCHLITAAPDSAGNPDPEIQKVREAHFAGRRIEWVRVNRLSEHVRFPHMRHVNAGLSCQLCHGMVQQMPRVFSAIKLNAMGTCTNCHMRRGITRDCTTCHF